VAGTAAAALSAADIWVGGTTSAGQPGIEHWNGHQWQATPLPALGPGLGCGCLTDMNGVTGIAIMGPDDVWADVMTLASFNSNPRSYILHWNGTAWARAPFPYTGIALTPVTSDGHDGLWLVQAANPGKEEWFCHYSAGHWTRTLVPPRYGKQPQMQNLAWIPGTGSLWAAGDVSFTSTTSAAILKYGT
jgi:hypothetical protein